MTTTTKRHYLNATRTFGLTVAVAALAACSSDKLDITNPNTPTVEAAAADQQALRLQATGILRQLRNGRGGQISEAGRFGREMYIYSPQEGRNTSHYLEGIVGQNKIDPSGFAVGGWAGPYGNLRDIFNLKNSAAASTVLSEAEKNATIGFAKTIEGLELYQVVATRDTLGGIVEIKQNASDLAEFVSRDSLYKYILNTLDEGNTALLAGGSAFPFTLHNGFALFNTPTDFAKFNRAITALVASYYATTPQGGAAAWQRTLTALNASFINTAATTRAALDAGAYHPYSGTTGDSPNPFFGSANDLYLHMSIETDAPLKADGTKDNRYLAKVKTKPARGPGGGVAGATSTLGYTGDANNAAPVSIIRNEELILIRAEALLATGDKAGALALINSIRVNSGGLAPTTLTAASSDAAILDELLVQKRYSLLLEGRRWFDMRRYNRLNTLPLDAPSHFRARVQPISQAECLTRAGKTGALAGPGC